MNWLGLGVLLYLLVFVIAAMGWRSFVVWRKTGVNPYKLGSSDSAHDFAGRGFKWVAAGIAVVAGACAFFPDAYDRLTIKGWPQQDTISFAGIVLMTIALAWVLVAQSQMGASWRIGIDTSVPTVLVQRGLFRYSRNPIFLGMRVCLLGILLALPNAANFTLCALGEVLLQIQVRLEEEHLGKLHGSAYQEYRDRTRRWL